MQWHRRGRLFTLPFCPSEMLWARREGEESTDEHKIHSGWAIALDDV